MILHLHNVVIHLLLLIYIVGTPCLKDSKQSGALVALGFMVQTKRTSVYTLFPISSFDVIAINSLITIIGYL